MTERVPEIKSGTASGIDQKELSQMKPNEAMGIVLYMGMIAANEVARRERLDEESVTVWDEAGTQIRYLVHDWEKAQVKKERTIFEKGIVIGKRRLQNWRRSI